jgi:hypothetical protein
MSVRTEGQITVVQHKYPHTGDPLTTKFGRWLNDCRAIESQWLVKQNNGYVTNVFRAVVDDFGTLVPTQQIDGYIANVPPSHRAYAMRTQWVA